MTFYEILDKLKGYLDFVIFDIQGSKFTLLTLLYIIISTTLLTYLSRKLSTFLDKKLLIKYIPEKGTRVALLTITRYLFFLFGFLFILNSSGFKLTTFVWMFGALGVGIGFGLQNIVNNFISGIIILFERPVKIGDRIQVGDIYGDVTAISMRATTILTNDNISIIVPNSELINKNVINWSHNDRRVRFRFPVGVSYNEKPEKVREVILRVISQNKGVLQYPEPIVLFDAYGDSSLNFNMMVWTSSYIQTPRILKSQLYYSLFEEFAKEGIEIPFPQRDLHIKSGLSVLETSRNSESKEENV